MSEHASGWDGEGVRALRESLGLTQQQLAAELGVRQQTVSEWETGLYRPRGASARMLSHVAERRAAYHVHSPGPAAGPAPADADGPPSP